MESGEPCWLVVCSLGDVHPEIVYDRAMREIFPRHDLRRFVEIPPRLCPRDMDMEYSYAIAPYRVESEIQLAEDYARRWHAFHDAGVDYPTLARSAEYEQESDEGEQEPLALDPPRTSTPSTSVGSSPLLAVSPRRAPDVQEPPRRRRRLEAISSLFPATPESVVKVQSPSAQANSDLTGADADSSADASHSTSH
ncbi:hypothetical protein Emag_007213 [Eimeria magna]